MYLLSFSCFWTLSLPTPSPLALSIRAFRNGVCLWWSSLSFGPRGKSRLAKKKYTRGRCGAGGAAGTRGGGRFAFSACSVAFGARGLYRPTPPARKKTQSQGMTKSAGLAAPSPSRDERNAAGVCSPPPPNLMRARATTTRRNHAKNRSESAAVFPLHLSFFVFSTAPCARNQRA